MPFPPFCRARTPSQSSSPRPHKGTREREERGGQGRQRGVIIDPSPPLPAFPFFGLPFPLSLPPSPLAVLYLCPIPTVLACAPDFSSLLTDIKKKKKNCKNRRKKKYFREIQSLNLIKVNQNQNCGAFAPLGAPRAVCVQCLLQYYDGASPLVRAFAKKKDKGEIGELKQQ